MTILGGGFKVQGLKGSEVPSVRQQKTDVRGQMKTGRIGQALDSISFDLSSGRK
jgi:hypothetical protein